MLLDMRPPYLVDFYSLFPSLLITTLAKFSFPYSLSSRSLKYYSRILASLPYVSKREKEPMSGYGNRRESSLSRGGKRGRGGGRGEGMEEEQKGRWKKLLRKR